MKLTPAVAALLSLTLITTLATCTHPTPKTSTTMPAASQPKPKPRARSNNAPADQSATRKDKSGNTDPDWLKTHEANVAFAKNEHINLLFIGDANTQRWTTTGKNVWIAEFHFFNPANFGIPGDTTQQILWRLQNGELPPKPPETIILSAGANNITSNTPEQTAASLAAITKFLLEKCPDSHILILAILPRNGPNDPQRKFDDAVNARLDHFYNGPVIGVPNTQIKFLDPSKEFLNPNNTLNEKLFESDTYLTEAGYQILANDIKSALHDWQKKSDR